MGTQARLLHDVQSEHQKLVGIFLLISVEASNQVLPGPDHLSRMKEGSSDVSLHSTQHTDLVGTDGPCCWNSMSCPGLVCQSGTTALHSYSRCSPCSKPSSQLMSLSAQKWVPDFTGDKMHKKMRYPGCLDAQLYVSDHWAAKEFPKDSFLNGETVIYLER